MLLEPISTGHSEIHLLANLSEQDKKFDIHKTAAMKMAEMLDSTQFRCYGQRIRDCSNYLTFATTADGLKLRQKLITVSNGRKVSSIRFCRVRGCPVCSWRRSLVWKARAVVGIPKLVAAHPNVAFLFLTLTLKNPVMGELRNSISHMQQAWYRMSRPYFHVMKGGQIIRSRGNPCWPALGYAKALEVTSGDVPGHCHPHFHALLAVPASYFSGGAYLTVKQWAQMWAEYMGLGEYQPRCHVKRVLDPIEQIPEIFKYEAKSPDLLGSQDFLLTYFSQMNRVRSVEVGGIFREFMRSSEPENLINTTDEDGLMSSGSTAFLEFTWKCEQLCGLQFWNYHLVAA